MRMLQWITENTRKDRLQNEESHLRLFGHVYRQAINTPVRAWIQVNGKKKGRRLFGTN